MVDTIKIFTFIPKKTYEKIKNSSDIKCMFSNLDGTIFYEIINSSLKGSYDSSLSVRVDEASRYGMCGYVLEVEGSYHKIVKGHNAYNGYYNIQSITLHLKELVENAYDLKLPDLKHWFLQRIDITRVYDLKENTKVQKYINYFRTLSYPRRNLKFYESESVYVSGQTTTLKIYNKLREFIKNDRKKLSKFEDFNLQEFMFKIDGYVRFELEIKKKKLKSIYGTNFIRIRNLNYNELLNVWCEEFMKILKFDMSEIKKVRKKESVKERLQTIYKTSKANELYNFYLSIKVDGENSVKYSMSKATFYRKRKELKDAGIDFTGCFKIFEEDTQIIDFNPFKDLDVEVM